VSCVAARLGRASNQRTLSKQRRVLTRRNFAGAAVNDLVSICLLSCERPHLVVQALQSCLAQTYESIEVLIGDDTRDDSVASALQPYLNDPRVRYMHHEKRLGQADNANRLFDRARGDRLLILHDDDLLTPDAIETLDRCWRAHPGLLSCYGKQLIISHSGQPLPDRTVAHGKRFYRTSEFAGLQKSKMWSALVAQMPPDTALVRTDAARATRLRPYQDVGDDPDFDFILRLARQPGEFFLVDSYVTRYRLTDKSLSNTKTIDYIFTLWRDVELPPELEPTRRALLVSGAAYAAYCFLLSGYRDRAWEIIRNDTYWPTGWSGRRLRMFAAVFAPTLALRGYHASRGVVGRLIRRCDSLYRLILARRHARSARSPHATT
jgi:glycosyltransferase involved in cell wall biosynthesis